jgi:CelD/BcsL family acetyltransferase involved in cellulose biosynthesis
MRRGDTETMQPIPDQETFAFERDRAPPAELSPIPAAVSNTGGPAGPVPATAALTICDLALVTGRAQFEALEPEWNALFERAGRPWQIFQTFNWLWHWANHYLDERSRLSLVTGWREDRLVMAWPLVMRRVAGLKQLSWMGAPVGEYGDVLLEQASDAPALLRQAWNLVKALDADLIYLRKIRSDAAVFPFLAETDAIVTEISSAPYLDLASADSFETYQQRYSAKTRSTYRRRLRRLNEMGRITFEQHTQGAVARDLVGRALVLKRGWLAQRGRFSRVLQDRRFAGFLEDVVQARTRPTGARISAVRCNGEPIGVEISFTCKGHAFGHVIAHDVAFRKHGVGAAIAQYSIRTAHEQGYARYDLLAPDDAYKVNWADASIALRDCAVPLSRGGAMYVRLWLCRARPWLKSLAKKMPAWIALLLSGISRAGGARLR